MLQVVEFVTYRSLLDFHLIQPWDPTGAAPYIPQGITSDRSAPYIPQGITSHGLAGVGAKRQSEDDPKGAGRQRKLSKLSQSSSGGSTQQQKGKARKHGSMPGSSPSEQLIPALQAPLPAAYQLEQAAACFQWESIVGYAGQGSGGSVYYVR